MSFPKLEAKKAELAAKQDDLRSIFAEAGDDLDMDKVTSLDGDSQAKVEEIRKRNTELDALAKEVEDLQAVHQAAQRVSTANGDDPHLEPGGGDPAKDKSFAAQLFGSDAWKVKGHTSQVRLPQTSVQMAPIKRMLNTLFETTAGWPPESTRSGRLVLSAEEPPRVTDLIPMIMWGQELYKYMEETTFTNAATEAAEGGTYPEATLAVTEQEQAIRKLPVWLPLTDEQLEDVPGARAYVESRLEFMLLQTLDQRLLTGDGTATPPQINGFHNTTGINSQALGTDPIPDAVFKAMRQVRVTGQAIPRAVVFHPENWEEVRLLRTSDGIYIWGNPSEAGPDRIWGLPVVQSAHETKGQALVGDFADHSLFALRRDVDVQVSNSHSTFFIEGKQAMRADMRGALVVLRPGAFTEITGMTA